MQQRSPGKAGLGPHRYRKTVASEPAQEEPEQHWAALERPGRRRCPNHWMKHPVHELTSVVAGLVRARPSLSLRPELPATVPEVVVQGLGLAELPAQRLVLPPAERMAGSPPRCLRAGPLLLVARCHLQAALCHRQAVQCPLLAALCHLQAALCPLLGALCLLLGALCLLQVALCHLQAVLCPQRSVLFLRQLGPSVLMEAAPAAGMDLLDRRQAQAVLEELLAQNSQSLPCSAWNLRRQ
jgi:hypothetical protein